jgi:hypothetical protein
MLKSKGWGPWKYEWYSLRSIHHFHNESCGLCQSGGWINCYKHIIVNFIYKREPNLWYRWANDIKLPGLLLLIKHFLYAKALFK